MKKKKTLVVGTALLLALVMGTSAYALDNSSEIKQMIPKMKEAHPDLTDKQLKEMYDSCHSGTPDASRMMDGDASNMMNLSNMGNMMKQGNMTNMMKATDK